jgi:O-succinylbenzoic acid--CoA ligase
LKFLILEDAYSENFSGLKFADKYFFSELPSAVNRSVEKSIKFTQSNTALILFTSGSTSKPKAVELTFANFYNSAGALNSEINFNTADSLLASLPFYHIGGFSIITRALIKGLPIILPNSLKPDDIYSAIQKFHPSIISIVPTTLKRFLDLNYLPDENLRCVFLGGGPIHNSITKNALSMGWRLFIVYGSTETCSMVTLLKTNEILERIDCAGKPIDDNRIFIKGSNGENLPANSEGTVVIKSRSVMKGFLNNNSARGYSDEYFSDDIGFLDENGYLYITGRSDDVIISGGENINCREVDKHVLIFPGVDECYCFGLEDDEWGQVLCSAIVVDNHRDFKETDLMKFLKNRLASFKIPKRYFVVGSILKNDLGKVSKKELLKNIIPN